MTQKHIMLHRGAAIAALLIFALLPLTAQAVAPFTVVALPDTQFYSESYPSIYTAQTQWIVNNKTAQNIAFVTHEGDVVNTASQAYEYTNANTSMSLLDGVVPWGILPGNHDYGANGGTIATYEATFPGSHFAGQSWYCPGGSAYNDASFQTFTAGNRTYLSLEIPFDAPTDTLTWAQNVINANPGKPTIITTHDYIAYGNTRSGYGNTLWSTLVNPNSQVFMVLCGHNHYEWNQTSTDAAGKPVFEVLADYQDGPYGGNGGNGYLRLYQFDEDASKIHVKTFSPYDTSGGTGGTYQTGSISQFDIPMNFNDRLGAAAAPEPSTLALAAAGLVALGGVAWRKRRAGRQS